MRDRLFSLLGIEPGRELLVVMLLTQSAFLGIFLGTFDVSAHSVFLSIFDEKIMARGYIASGFTGIILTLSYNQLQKSVIFRHLILTGLFFVTLVTSLLWLLLVLSPSHIVVFLVFVMLGPLNLLALRGMRENNRHLSDLLTGTRIFGRAETWLIIGITVSCFAIPLLLSMNFNLFNILLISSVSVLLVSMLQVMIGRKFLRQPANSESATDEPSDKESLINQIRTDKDKRIAWLFITLSVVTLFFIQYSFMAASREQYPAGIDLASFLGLFTGCLMVVTLVLRILAFPFIIRKFGLRICLLISPVLVGIITLIAFMSGVLKGYTTATSGFLAFFIFLALSRLLSKSLKESVEDQSLKATKQVVPDINMNDTVNEVAALFSGLLLTSLGLISSFKLIHFSMVLFLIIIIWGYVALKLYSRYRYFLKGKLITEEKNRAGNTLHGIQKQYSSVFARRLFFRKEYFNMISGTGLRSELKNNVQLRNMILEYADTHKDINLLTFVKALSGNPVSEEERQHSMAVAENLQYILSYDHSKDDKVINAKKMLTDSRQPQTTYILRLLREKSVELRSLGIYLIGKFRVTDMIPEVCECLGNPDTIVPAACVLKTFGEKAVSELERYFMRSSGNIKISNIILQLLSGDCKPDNMNFLFLCLWSGSRQIKETALDFLETCEFRATDEDKEQLLQVISEIIGIIAWTLAARIALRQRNEDLLIRSINKELSRWNSFLFKILSITYGSGYIQNISKNLESGTIESVSLVREISCIVMDESIYTRIIPLLDNISDDKKVKFLTRFYSVEIPTFEKLVEDIINRDYNLLGIWIRACILRSLDKVEDGNLAESLVALLFSPETILQEESARLIARSGKEFYKSFFQRVPSGAKEKLSRIIDGKIDPEDMLYEKVMFLSICFPEVSEERLLCLADSLEYRNTSQAAPLPENGYIEWSIKSGEKEFFPEIINEKINDERKGTKRTSGSFYYLPFAAIEDFLFLYPELENDFLSFIESRTK